MCGRYRLSRRKQIIEKHFDSTSGDEDWTPRYNVAPTQPVPIIRQHPKEPHRAVVEVAVTRMTRGTIARPKGSDSDDPKTVSSLPGVHVRNRRCVEGILCGGQKQ